MQTINTTETQIDQIVTFSLENEEFAFPISVVKEIVRPPSITYIPGAPAYVKGITNLRGNILPIIDLRLCFNMNKGEQNDSTRVIVLTGGEHSVGVVVDSVSEVFHVEPNMLKEPPPTINNQETGAKLTAIAKVKNTNRLIMILDTKKILSYTHNIQSTQYVSPQHSTYNNKNYFEKTGTPDADDPREGEELLVVFNLANEEYGINIMNVREIIRVSPFTETPMTPSFVKGIIALRETLLPIIDLRTRLNIPDFEKTTTKENDSQRIVVLDTDGTLIGILVDSVSEVIRIEKNKIAPPPESLNTEGTMQLRGVAKLNHGKRLVMLLDVKTFFSENEQKELKKTSLNTSHIYKSGEKSMGKEEQFVCFKIDNEEYAMSIMEVREIIREGKITVVPKAPEFVRGIVNLRGTVLPVIDMRKRLHLPEPENSKQSRVVVTEINGTATGFIVDSVSEVIRFAENQLEPPPEVVINSEKGKFIDAVGKLNNGERIIMIINAEKLLKKPEDNNITTQNSINENEFSSGKTDYPKLSTETITNVNENTLTTNDKNEQSSQQNLQKNSSQEIPLSKMNKTQLISQAKKLGIKYHEKMTNKELRKLIKEAR